MMRKTKITPGPWAVHPLRAQIDAFDGTDGDGEPEPLAVCKLLWPTEERPEEETQANARAISAVPEMIEALLESYYTIMSEVKSWDLRIDQHHMYATFCQIEAALKKAGVEFKETVER